MQARTGQNIGTSRWFEMDQARIDAFAALTEDDQFIHTDPDRARDTPFGGTIAHGFLTLSMLSAMIMDCVPMLAGAEMGVNYGFDRVRFMSPVPAGARIRGQFKLLRLEHGKRNDITTLTEVTVEIQGQKRPALIAEWIGRQYLTATNNKESRA